MDDNNQTDQRDPVRVFEGVVPRSLLEYMNSSIDTARHEWRPADGRRAATMARNFAELLRASDSFNAVESRACSAARRWAAVALGKELAGEPLYVLRCVDSGMPSQSYLRHYDSHILTILIILQLADGYDRCGDLIVYKRERGSISSIANVRTKTWLMIEHVLPLPVRRALVDRDRSKGRCGRIVCSPGNVYVFNGFVTLHSNVDVESGERRSLIIHYYDPGLTAGLQRITQTFRGFRDRLADLF
jgi:hypothetical protein